MRTGVPTSDRGVRVERLGYTIVEVMIFLAVTGFLFAAIAVTFQGQRGRAQFSTGAREMESRVRDIANNTVTGYYQSSASFTCTASAAGPVFTNTPSIQGSNQGCIFLGPVLHFDVDGNGENYNLYTVGGLRHASGSNKEVESFTEAKPRAIASQSPNGTVDITQRLKLPNGATVERITYNNGGGDVPIDAVGFFTTFGVYSTGVLQPGSISVNVVPLGNAGPSSQANVVGDIAALGTAGPAHPINPSGGVTLCINSGSSNQSATLTIGGGNRNLSTDLKMGDDLC